MKRQAFRTVAMWSLFLMLAAVSVHAQSGQRLVANIPFDFVVMDKTLPAGQYTIERSPNISGVMKISGDGIAALSSMNPKRSSQPRNRTELVFHRYGDKYYLVEVWKSGEDSGVKLPTSRSERALKRELAKNASSGQTAKNTAQPEVVTLIASR